MRIKECERNWGRKPGDWLATKIEGLFRDDSWAWKSTVAGRMVVAMRGARNAERCRGEKHE